MYERILRILSQEELDKIQNIKVLIVGLGGVGGYALETLVRSGVLNIDILDFDKIDITNLNRQIITNNNNIDKYKVDEAYNRALSINPKLNIKKYNIYLDEKNIHNILINNYDYIIDACDKVDTKIELIKNKEKYKYDIISCMGTAKKLDPTKLSITSLDKTNYDKLASVIRKKVRNLKINPKTINVVSSTEEIIKCNLLGSLMMVPATAGILCAKYVIDNIIKD